MSQTGAVEEAVPSRERHLAASLGMAASPFGTDKISRAKTSFNPPVFIGARFFEPRKQEGKKDVQSGPGLSKQAEWSQGGCFWKRLAVERLQRTLSVNLRARLGNDEESNGR
jgi:hypothetical protein